MFIDYFVYRSRLTFLLTIMLLIAGLFGVKTLQRESIPNVDFATVTITTPFPGAAPDEVEDLVTIKIEEELNGIDGIKKVKSVSQAGISEINIQIDIDRFESDRVTDEIQRAVQRVTDLPAELPQPPRIVQIKAGEVPVIELGLVGPNENRKRDEIAEELEDLLEDVRGVADVRLTGYSPREVTVLLDQAKLRKHSVSLKEVTDAARNELQNIPGGYVRSDGKEQLVRVRGKTTDEKTIEDYIVRGTFEGGAVRIGDVGQVVNGMAEPTLLARIDGSPATLLVVTKKPAADTIDVVERIKERIRTFRLDPAYKVVVYNNEEVIVRDKLKIVVENSLLGLVFILAVLLVLLPGSIGVAASMSIPLIILALTAGMSFFGLSFNIITTISAVIVLGLLVDNSAVVAEAYANFRSQKIPQREAAALAAKIFFVPILATLLCNFAGFAPLLVTTGVLGQFIYSIPVVIGIALVFSLFETFFLLPARLSLTLRKPPELKSDDDYFDSGWFGVIQRSFFRLLTKLLKFKYLTAFCIFLVFFSSLMVAAFLNKFELFPRERTELFTGRFEAALGTTLKRTDELAGELSLRVADKLKSANVEFNAIAARSGLSRVDFNDPQDRTANHVGFLFIGFPIDAKNPLPPNELARLLSDVTVDGLGPVRWQESGGGPPVGLPLDIVFRSTDDKKLERAVDEFKAKISELPGALNVKDDRFPGADELSVKLNRDLVRSAGISLADVGEALRTALQGEVVSNLNVNSREVEVRVRFDDKDRAKLQDLKEITVKLQDDNRVPLSSVARVENVAGPRVRKRFSFQRAVQVSADVDTSKLTSLEINQKARDILSKMDLEGISIITGGEEEETKESFQGLLAALSLSILAILLILVIVYNSFGQAFLVLSTIPLGLAGVSYVFWLAGRPLGFMALIGVIGLGGVVVNASIVLLSFIKEAREKTPERSLRDLVAEVTAKRFKAVFITNATTIFGLLPSAYGFSGDDPLLVPLTLAMGWGLLVGSAMALVWIPAGYLILEDLYKLRKFRSRGQSHV